MVKNNVALFPKSRKSYLLLGVGGSSKYTPDSPGAHSLCRIQVCELLLPGPAEAVRGLGDPPAHLGLCCWGVGMSVSRSLSFILQ